MKLTPHLLVFIVLATRALTATPAEAQMTDDERARQHFLAGSSYYDQSRYEDAAREFFEAYRLSERPQLLLNASRALESADQFAPAVEALRRYLEAVPDAPDRKTIESRIATLEERIAKAAPPEVESSGTGASPEAPTEAPATAEVDGGGATDLSVPAYITMGAAGLFGVIALATGLKSNKLYGDLDEACSADRVCPADRKSDADKGQALAATSTAFTVLMGASLGAGIVMLLVSDGGTESVEHAAVRVVPGPGELGAGMAVSF